MKILLYLSMSLFSIGLKAQELTPIWEKEYGIRPKEATLDYENGFVYLGGENGELLKVSAENGDSVQQFERGYCPSLVRDVYIFERQGVVVARCLGGLTSWDLETGQIIMTREFRDKEFSFEISTPHYEDGLLYVVVYAGIKGEEIVLHSWNPVTGEEKRYPKLNPPHMPDKRVPDLVISNITPEGDFLLYSKGEMAANLDIEGLYLMNTADMHTKDTLLYFRQFKDIDSEANTIDIKYIHLSEDNNKYSIITDSPMLGTNSELGTAYVYDLQTGTLIFEKKEIDQNETFELLDDNIAVNFCGSNQWPAIRYYNYKTNNEIYYSGGLQWKPEYADARFIITTFQNKANMYELIKSDIKESPINHVVSFYTEHGILKIISTIVIDDLHVTDIKGSIIYRLNNIYDKDTNLIIPSKGIYHIVYTVGGKKYAKRIYVD